MANDFVAGDTNSKLEVICTNAETEAIINITLFTVKLRFKFGMAAVKEETMTKTDATNGVAEWQFTVGQLVLGLMEAEILLDNAGSQMTSIHVEKYEVRARLA